MDIDWDAPAAVDESTIRILSQEIQVTQGGGGGPLAMRRPFGPDEDPDGARYIGPGPSAMPRSITIEERLEQLEAVLQELLETMPADRRADGNVIRQVVADARSGLAKIESGERKAFTRAQAAALEAVVQTVDRPPLEVRNGFVNLDRKHAKTWVGLLKACEAGIRKVIPAVGAVRVGGVLHGTAFVIAAGLVVTNRHVLDQIAKPLDDRWVFNSETEIDFASEVGADETARFKVIDVKFAGKMLTSEVDVRNLDLAVLKVDQGNGAGFPDAVKFSANRDLVQKADNICVIGFPARDSGEEPIVIQEYFQDTFGVKRLAPGEVDGGIGEDITDIEKWAFIHDATTLGGNSGSCVVALSTRDTPVIGIHFSGIQRKLNYAHAVAALQQELIAEGATFV